MDASSIVLGVSSIEPTGDGLMSSKQRDLVAMTAAEVVHFLQGHRTLTLSSHNNDGSIHSVAMWYGFVGGDVAFSTRLKSQKSVNIRRDSNITCLVENGSRVYDELKGVEIIGIAEIIDEPALRFEQARTSYERNVGPYSDDVRALVEGIVEGRLVVRVRPRRIVSWDHSKLPPRGQIPLSAQRRAQR